MLLAFVTPSLYYLNHKKSLQSYYYIKFKNDLLRWRNDSRTISRGQYPDRMFLRLKYFLLIKIFPQVLCLKFLLLFFLNSKNNLLKIKKFKYFSRENWSGTRPVGELSVGEKSGYRKNNAFKGPKKNAPLNIL